LFTALIFIPLERVFALHPEQPVVRKGARTDLAHFFVSHVSVQAVTFLAVFPAAIAFRFTAGFGLQESIAAQPVMLQFLAIMLLADLVEYAVHRAYHSVPALWRFHAVHHSSRDLDWLAASRIHIVEALSMRALTYLPIYVLGFSAPAIFAYLAFVSFHAIFIHANINWRFLWLDGWFVTPRYHHWHHADEIEAYDKNFALHFPLWDRLFGTYYLPAERWPAAYGVRDFPELGDYFAHLAYPFRRRPKETKPVSA
jgi:lathosterol oxidase